MNIKIKINAGEAKNMPPLSVILGQHQISAQKVSLDFNSKTNDILAGVPINTIIKKKNTNEFEIIIGNPCISHYIQNITTNINFVSCLDLYDIYKILDFLKKNNQQDKFIIAKSIFSLLKSFKMQVKFL